MLPSVSHLRPFAAALAVALLAAPAGAQQAGGEVTRVSVAAAYTEALLDEVQFIGKGKAIDTASLVARVNGFLQESLVSDGEEVTEGQLLFRIEPDAYQAALEARQADRARAGANLELTKIELERKNELVRRQAAPQSEADIAKANEAVAEADVQATEAAIRAAELDLSYTEIRAPFPGRLGAIQISVGDIVGPSTPALVTIVRLQPMDVEFSLSEKQLINLLEHIDADVHEVPTSGKTPPVFLTLPNGTKIDEPGRVVFIDNRIDPATGTIALRARFDNARGLIIDGGFVNVTVQAMAPEEKLLIPQAAVQRDQRGDFVLVVTSDGLVEQRYVQLGAQHGTAVIVDDGLREGESVIVEGLQRVRPGGQVEAVAAGQPVE